MKDKIVEVENFMPEVVVEKSFDEQLEDRIKESDQKIKDLSVTYQNRINQIQQEIAERQQQITNLTETGNRLINEERGKIMAWKALLPEKDIGLDVIPVAQEN